MLASLGYEVRLVVDWTDHVWTEVRLGPLAANGMNYNEYKRRRKMRNLSYLHSLQSTITQLYNSIFYILL